MRKIIFGTILIVLGLSALLGISLLKFFFAFILIAIGIKIIIGNEYNLNFDAAKPFSSENLINELNIFSSADRVIKSENFKGGRITMIFSGGKIDLRHISTSESVINLEIIAIFGGAELIVPKGWKVNSQGTSIFGGYDTKIEGEGNSITLNLKGVAIFGGVKVTN
ncbi:hypothetical protein HY311_03865 [Candidatus Nomurabacteria bacterium]|nr:hypothetical protein [Candidatus Nomurabacteria bacterium]